MDKDIYREIGGVGGKREKNDFLPLHHLRTACTISYQHFRNVDSNRPYVGSSAAEMLIVTGLFFILQKSRGNE